MQIEVTHPAGESGLIIIIDGLLDPKQGSSLIERLETVWDKSHHGKTLGGVDPKTKTTEDIHFSNYAFNKVGISWDYLWNDLETHFAEGLTSAISIYKQQYRHLDTWIEVSDTGFQVQRYPKNFGYYRPHVDCFPSINSPVVDRVLACVIYLNDVCFGGETNFPLHKIKVEPRAGRIVLFPAVWTHPHESCAPISGDKWIISTFIVNAECQNTQQQFAPPSTQNVVHHQANSHHDHDHDHDHIHHETKSNVLVENNLNIDSSNDWTPAKID